MNTIKTTFDGLEEMGFESVTDFCRALIKEPGPYEVSPETKIEVYRGDMLCLTVNDIRKAAKLRPTGVGFTKYRP